MRDAVAITKVTVGSSEIQAGLYLGGCKRQPIETFEAGDDWLKDTTLSVFNRTNKTIAFQTIDLRFPEAGQRIYSIRLGRVPANAAFFGRGRVDESLPQADHLQALHFLPGQTLTIRVGDLIEQIRQRMESDRPLAAYTQVFVSSGEVFFEDGMRWSGNVFAIPNRQTAGAWKNMDELYFPGDREDNLPPGQHWIPVPCGR